MAYTFISDLAEELEIPQDGTLSKVLYRDDQLRLVGFAFDTGQELTEHTAAVPVLIQVVSGRLSVTLEADTMELGPDGWLRMEAPRATFGAGPRADHHGPHDAAKWLRIRLPRRGG